MSSIAIGCDHAGFEFKESLKKWLEQNQHVVKDYGTYSTDSADYPDFAHAVANGVETKEQELGILICGSANGVAITANKHQQIRAAICWLEEIASLARLHNNANVVCIPARFVDYETAQKIVDTFLTTKFEGGRHEKRVSKISC